ncbi:hypothetical protein GDO86_000601 [Hymenochirus boettgeri]|uniref:Uncharacterized protein n=1 Tax=Hymenochirus boettgeri TaxID=247094 RepID=A0A8T2KA67_9PIPI|nr:hypothetical protein GDO86_000601 [Hymenochirus boettgeri]
MEEQQVRRLAPDSDRNAKSEGSIKPGPDPSVLAERRNEARGYLQSLCHHSYWFDLWIFMLFDLVLFIFVSLFP